jgi:hypothetical protein
MKPAKDSLIFHFDGQRFLRWNLAFFIVNSPLRFSFLESDRFTGYHSMRPAKAA